ncbi:HAD family hydrolase [Agrilactobacillus yilanensis]|uniref:HAD family hydrolase n=1 Tax=Agrilactobacillus yilanensis TaxID=2485997 RepID=A0ABW4J641_9LACO|nr:HAD family phosphatase [Agrilactobacillus yilanensis]
MYKGIIWDMDGLIFNSEAIYLKANVKAGEIMGTPVTAEEYYELVGASEEEAHEFNTAHFKDTAQQAEFYALTEDLVLEMVQAGEMAKKPGLDELLSYLQQQGINSIIASSNNQKMVQAFLGFYELTPQFQAIITREQVSASKPDPSLFLKAQQVFDKPKQELLVLEDSKNGIIAANAAGIDVLMIPDLIQPDAALRQKTVAVLPDLAKVIDYIKNTTVN